MFDHAKKTITRVSERARVLFCVLAMHSFLSVLATIPTTTEVNSKIVSYLVFVLRFKLSIKGRSGGTAYAIDLFTKSRTNFEEANEEEIGEAVQCR